MSGESLQKLVPGGLPARLAPYLDAITDARMRGITWWQIARELAPDLELAVSHDKKDRRGEKAIREAYARARRAIEQGRLKAVPVPVTSKPGSAITTPPATIGGKPKSTFNFNDHLINK